MNQFREQNVLPSFHSSDSVSDLKDVSVVLYKVLYGKASSVVLPVYLEQRGAKHYGQVMEVHLVHLRKTLHTKNKWREITQEYK